MSKTCKNCDHRKICEEWWRSDMYRDIKEMQEVWGDNCEHWNGWYDAENMPKEDGTYIIYGKCRSGESIGECYYTTEYGFAALNFNIIAWRELPKYESKED